MSIACSAYSLSKLRQAKTRSSCELFPLLIFSSLREFNYALHCIFGGTSGQKSASSHPIFGPVTTNLNSGTEKLRKSYDKVNPFDLQLQRYFS